MQHKPFQLSVKAAVFDNQGRCLVMRRSPAAVSNVGLWDLPGGNCDPGEPMEVALRREVDEETGLQVRLQRVVGSTQCELSDRIVVYLILEAEAIESEVQLSDEHDEYRWVPRSTVPSLEFAPQFSAFVESCAHSDEPATTTRTEAWFKAQISQFRKRRRQFERLAKALKAVLEDETAVLGIHAIVQSRAKTVTSFAEKIQRPGKNYTDPINELTDLCGARVIAHTLSEVKAICNFVEERFQVFWEDSGDKAETLGASEFGYLSRHYIVSLKPGEFSTDKASTKLVDAGLKAEIQVRTILQHAWADTAHELSYKNNFTLPRRWKREFARLAAVLEEADRGFDEIATGLKEYDSSYHAYLDRAHLEQELDRHQMVLNVDPENEGLARQMAKLAMTLDNWPRAIELLTPLAKNETASGLRDLGVSLCKLHRKQVDHPDFRQGQAYLARATELDPRDTDAWASLAGTWRTCENATSDPARKADCRRQAKQFYRRAFEVDHSNPYPLGNYIEYEIADHPELDIVSFFGPSLKLAERRCRNQAEVSVNLPWAYFDIGKFNLMLRKPYQSFAYYAKGIDHSTAPFQSESAASSFDTLAVTADSLPGFHWAREFLRLANAFRFKDRDTALLPATPSVSAIKPPVVIVAGYCGNSPTPEHRDLLVNGLRDFQGTVISGGTTAGISALVGELQVTHPGVLHTIGYLPATIPADVKLDKRYTEHRRTTGEDFSLLEPLRYWADLLAAGVDREAIRMIIIGGGPISACECHMALALGVRTAVIAEPRAAEGCSLKELNWLAHSRLQRDVTTAEALRRFLGPES